MWETSVFLRNGQSWDVSTVVRAVTRWSPCTADGCGGFGRDMRTTSLYSLQSSILYQMRFHSNFPRCAGAGANRCMQLLLSSRRACNRQLCFGCLRSGSGQWVGDGTVEGDTTGTVQAVCGREEEIYLPRTYMKHLPSEVLRASMLDRTEGAPEGSIPSTPRGLNCPRDPPVFAVSDGGRVEASASSSLAKFGSTRMGF